MANFVQHQIWQLPNHLDRSNQYQKQLSGEGVVRRVNVRSRLRHIRISGPANDDSGKRSFYRDIVTEEAEGNVFQAAKFGLH